MNCPGCHNPMEEQTYDARYGAAFTVDLCFACHLIWFDGQESGRLSPGSVLRLFGAIHARKDDPRRALPDAPACPRCASSLAQTHDLQRQTRFTYQRCVKDCGRLITFFHFLREKDFAQSLTPRQLAELKTHVKVVTCSNCGASVDLERGATCEHCRAPLAFLNPETVQKALAQLNPTGAPTEPTKLSEVEMQLVKDRMHVENYYAELDRREGRRLTRQPGNMGSMDSLDRRDERSDLLELGVEVVINAVRAIF